MIEIKQSELSQILIDLDSVRYVLKYLPERDQKLLVDRIKKDGEFINKIIKELKGE